MSKTVYDQSASRLQKSNTVLTSKCTILTSFASHAAQGAFVVTFGRAGEDKKFNKLGDVEATLQGFAGADYDLQVLFPQWLLHQLFIGYIDKRILNAQHA